MNYDVAGLGTVLVDQQVVLSNYPEVDTKNEILAHRLQVGGPVPTTLVQLSRFGKKCLFVGRWGLDTFGEFIQRDLKTENVNIDHCVRDQDGSSGFAHVWVDGSSGSRTVAYTRGGLSDIPSSTMDKQWLAECRLLHLDGWSSDAAVVGAKIVKKSGGQVFLDSGAPKPGMEKLIPLVDVMNCPARFAQQYFHIDDVDQAARKLLALGVKTVVFTQGAAGAILYHGCDRIKVPAFDVSTIDTTGAGDVFVGGMIYALLEQWPLDKAVRFASATAALKCTAMGNRGALPSLEQVEALLSS